LSLPPIVARLSGNQRGGILLFLLVAVTILGLSAGMAGSTWTSIVQRAKEQDLLWKGDRIRKAIGSYYETKGTPGTPLRYPQSVDDLLRDNRSLNARRHLRQPYLDPMTGEDWEWIKAPEGGIKGVRSTSKKKPFKMDGFSEDNKNFAGMWQYRDWEFIYQPQKKVVKKPPATKGSETPK
jgi:type II secretory pathway pseudopilin PulG